ncbi:MULTISPECIES: hypothetical protein [Myxococcus]|uniref:hypothetical protein n=1 Tax=Myxococcus TaxID=32 RepID=UPI001143C1B9|nr:MULTISPECIES: hypothetical protein [Myxococcus]NOJ57728.1 hypothetical protein [Myxococcus xanthus]QPM81674.1 hypothetical protein I5Q59_10555 [Myxococcus xanthus]QVW70926.1 hypothetical protein JTM82_15920 [Myxococcus xanthus DZ2]UEO02946.1 hypothetical protein K1515_26895 [Myxococcus xanthus DZ2]UYI16806.1 hypothetical protein N3T43_11000 [Myxococcus xanthus]
MAAGLFTDIWRSDIFMSLDFLIQAGLPRTLRVFDGEDESLADAVQTVFPRSAEWAFVVWRGVFIPVGYKYDLSLMVDDVVDMLEEILRQDVGGWEVSWPSNTFSSTWKMSWDGSKIAISADWDCVVGGVGSLLSDAGPVLMAKMDFVSEWKAPLVVVERALREAGYTEAHLPSLAGLSAIIGRVPEAGFLYRT